MLPDAIAHHAHAVRHANAVRHADMPHPHAGAGLPGLGTDQSLAQFSHEIRNCLGTARNALSLLESDSVTGLDRSGARMLLGRQLEQMTRLVGDLMDASLASSGRLRLHCERIDLRTPLSRAFEATEFRMRQRRHRARLSLSPVPVWVDGDAARLEQVFVNLLVNAAKYTDMGGVITVSLRELAHEVVVRVADNGIGIAPDMLSRIFEPYVQAQPATRRGVGLGLALVRNLVESHGGRVAVESEGLGRGSEFSVWLPLPEPQNLCSSPTAT